MLGCHAWRRPSKLYFSTPPLNEEGILNQPHLIFELHKLLFAKCLGEYICHLIICLYVLEPHNSLLYIISYKVIADVNMLATIMKHVILREPDATLIITMYHGSL
jgi:hypothetical protein